MSGDGIYTVRQYVAELTKWTRENNITEFYHCDLPDYLKNAEKRWIHRASERGYIIKVSKRPTNCTTLWKIRRPIIKE